MMNDGEELLQPLLPEEFDEVSEDQPDSSHDGNPEVNDASMVVAEESFDSNNPWRNRNVLLSLGLCTLSGIADSIWSSVVLSGFLLALAKAMGDESRQNTLVGTAEAVEGLAQLMAALPVGVLADTWSKARVVQCGGFLMFFTIGGTLMVLIMVHNSLRNSETDDDSSFTHHAATKSYYGLVTALAFWGIVGGISYGPAQALYADSIQKGRRSEMLTVLYSCYLLSSAVGPIVSIILFLTVSSSSENWSLQEILPVFFIGVALEVPSAVIMLFFSDKHAVAAQREELEEQAQSSPETGEDAASGSSTLVESEPHSTGKKAIPYVLFLSSLVVSLGSGASVKYFPLFFKELGLSSAGVQFVFLLVPISISFFSFLAQRLSKTLGRIETTVLTDVVGTSLLYVMTWLSRQRHHVASHDAHSLWKDRPYYVVMIIAIYLARTGIMNCSYPLLESILMDSVPSNQRARWKSLESIASFGWTGSALVGGVLSDDHSYEFTFAITATMQLIGGLLLLPIQPFVAAEETPAQLHVVEEHEEIAEEEEEGEEEAC